MTTSGATSPRRFAGIDYLKAAAILVVLFIHVYVTIWSQSTTMWWLASASRFAVPAFFFAAGFLTSPTSPNPRPRIVRVLIPYLIASTIALIWRALAGAVTVPRALFELVTAGAVQPYYFVLVYIVMVCLAPLLLWRRWLLWIAIPIALGLAFAAEQGLTTPYAEPPLAPMYWRLRDPLRWAVYFFAGLETRRQIRHIDAWPAMNRVAGSGLLGTLWLASFWICAQQCGDGRDTLFVALEMLRTFCVIGAFVLFFRSEAPAQPVRWLSDSTYPIYLYHLLILAFIQPMILEGVLPAYYIEGRPVRYFIALGGSILIVHLARRFFGRRAKVLVG